MADNVATEILDGVVVITVRNIRNHTDVALNYNRICMQVISAVYRTLNLSMCRAVIRCYMPEDQPGIPNKYRNRGGFWEIEFHDLSEYVDNDRCKKLFTKAIKNITFYTMTG